MSKFIDKTGQRFGRLVVMSKAEDHLNYPGHTRWLCQCDCGNTIIAWTSNLLTNSSHTVSCGCYQKEYFHIKRYGNAEPNDRGAFDALYNSYRRNAKNRSLVWGLSRDEFGILTKQDCYYCGDIPAKVFVYRGSSQKLNLPYIYNGIDRVDNSCGYETGNVVSCCWECNHMKGTIPQEKLLFWVGRVYSNRVSI